MHILLEKRCIANSELRRPCPVGAVWYRFCNYNHGQKSWDTWVSGTFSHSHRTNPSPHPTNNVERVYPEFFRVSTLYRVGGGRTARKFRKGCTEMTEKNEYCSTVPTTFVQDCSKNSSEKLFGFLVLSYLVYRIQFYQFTCILLLFNYWAPL